MIPSETLLEDRLAIVGTAGSGKTYASGVLAEQLLHGKHRVIVVDPLGVWYGLRLSPGGKRPSGFQPVIFGGKHGDLTISEHSGQIIGEAVAGSAQSCIIDLSQFGTKAAERRFMLAFLTALYRATEDSPVHLIFDEADMWAPQVMYDKDGDAARLLGMMETIVRRGRVKGFTPWLITQRPAVLSKNVLSQADGVIAFKLTSSQDRDAIGAWVEGQADKGEWKKLYGDLATLPRGTGIVWLPGRSVLQKQAFPAKVTFDSSRTPKRGEARSAVELKPIDIGALQKRMASVEAETKANDPKALKAEIASVKSQISKSAAPALIGITPEHAKELEAKAWERGRAEGFKEGKSIGNRHGAHAQMKRLVECLGNAAMLNGDEDALRAFRLPQIEFPTDPELPSPVRSSSAGNPVEGRGIAPNKAAPPRISSGPGEPMGGPQRKLLTVLAQYPQGRSKKQLAILAGYSHNGGAFNNPLANLRSKGWAKGGPENISITDDGVAALGEWHPLPVGAELREHWLSSLEGPPAKLLKALCDTYPGGLSKAKLAQRCGYQVTGGAFNNPLSRLRALELVTGKGGEEIRASDDLF